MYLQQLHYMYILKPIAKECQSLTTPDQQMNHIALHTFKTRWSVLSSQLQKTLELPGVKFWPYLCFLLKLFLVSTDLRVISLRISLYVLSRTTQIMTIVCWALTKMSHMCICWNCHNSKIFGNSVKSKSLG